jgi:putative heme transporter
MTRQQGRAWWRRLRWVVLLGALVAAVLVLRGRLPGPAAVLAAIRTASPGWLLLAAALEAISMGMFARQQRRLLRAFGVRMSLPRALALTFSRTAMTVALPAGSAVSAGYAYQEFRARGASRATASTVTVLSGVASVAGLLALYLTGALGSAVPWLVAAWRAEPASVSVTVGLAVLTAATLLAMLLALGWSVLHPGPGVTPARSARPARGLTRWRAAAQARTAVAQAAREARELPIRHWYVVIALAAANWLADLACLAAVAHAFHLSIGLFPVASAYLAVQVVRQIPVTPGGTGLVETSLLAGLVSAGAAHAPAAAVVLGYRLLSCWVMLPIGLLAWLAMRASRGAVADSDPAPHETRARHRVPSQRSPAARVRHHPAPRLGARPGSRRPGGLRAPRTRIPS